MYVCVYTSIYVYMYVCLCLRMYACMYVYVHVFVRCSGVILTSLWLLAGLWLLGCHERDRCKRNTHFLRGACTCTCTYAFILRTYSYLDRLMGIIIAMFQSLIRVLCFEFSWSRACLRQAVWTKQRPLV